MFIKFIKNVIVKNDNLLHDLSVYELTLSYTRFFSSTNFSVGTMLMDLSASHVRNVSRTFASRVPRSYSTFF